MGCHTWFWQRIERSFDDAKENYHIAKTKELDSLQRCIDSPTKDDIEMAQIYSWTSSHLRDWIADIEQEMDIVASGYRQCIMWENQPDTDDESVVYVKDAGFYRRCKDKGDTFRTVHTEEKLFCYDQTIHFCDKNGIELNSNQIKSLKDFWDEYPEGMIDFG